MQQAIDDVPAAISSVNSALQLEPQNTHLKMIKAQLLIQINELSEVGDLLDALRADNTENANFWLTQALFNRAKEEQDKATKNLIKALEVDPYFSQALILLYKDAVRGENKEAFIAQAESIVRDYPKNVLAKNILAQFYYIQHDFRRAKALYQSLLEEDKSINRAIVLNTLATMALEEDLTTAQEYIVKAFELNSTHPEILDTMGWILVQKGQL